MSEFEKWLNQIGGGGLDHFEIQYARKAWKAATERAAEIAEGFPERKLTKARGRGMISVEASSKIIAKNIREEG